MSIRRFSILLILLLLWDSIDDQCVAFAQRLSHSRTTPGDTSDDDDFIPFSLVYRAQIIDNIRATHYALAAVTLPSFTLQPPTADLLYLFMSLQL